MRRETQNILLVLAGGALLKISLGTTYLRYVQPAHRPWLIAGGLVMVLLAAVAIAQDIRASGRVHHAADGGVAEDHQHTSRSAWLLLLPVLAIFLVAPPALGADSVKRSDSTGAAARSSRAPEEFPPLPAADVVPIGLGDLVTRAAWDTGHSLDGRTVELSGFVVQDGASYVARLSIACCAADAFPVKVRLDGGGAGTLAGDTWVRVRGVVQPGTARKETGYVPTLTVSALDEIEEPEDPYEQ